MSMKRRRPSNSPGIVRSPAVKNVLELFWPAARR